jgi:ribonuclease HI
LPTPSSSGWGSRRRRPPRRRSAPGDHGAGGLTERDAIGRRGFVIRTDGAARGNPGPASIGVALIDLDRPDAQDPGATPDASISDSLGRATNNVAEWTAVVRGLELAHELGAREVALLLDSKLIVEQLAGRWRVKDPKLGPLYVEAHRLLRGFERWAADHVPRALNATADALANEALDRVARGGPSSVVLRPGDPRPDAQPRTPRSRRTDGAPIEAWLDGYRRAWTSNDPDDIRALFSDDAVYRPSPFAPAVTGREAIVTDWLERRDEPGTWSFESEALCSSPTLAILSCRIGYRVPDTEYRTIWLVRFDPDGRAREFSEWWMERPRDVNARSES